MRNCAPFRSQVPAQVQGHRVQGGRGQPGWQGGVWPQDQEKGQIRIFLFKSLLVMVLEPQHILYLSGLHIYDEIRYLTFALKK